MKTGYVIAKCPGCKQKKQYDINQPLNYTPMCDKCYLPMLITKIVVKNN